MKNIYLIIGIFTSTSAFAQFNTVTYQNSSSKLNYSINSKIETGNVFIDELKLNKKEEKDLKKIERNSKKKEKKSISKEKNLSYNFKDSLNFYIKKPEYSKINENQTIKENESFLIKKLSNKKLPLLKEVKQLVYMPLENMTITSNYGFRIHPIDGKKKLHNGVDLRAKNNYVFSVLNGKVIETGYNSSNGNYIVLQHENFNTYYLHLDSIIVQNNELINAGTIIGISGNTGLSTAPHLHFAVKEDGKYIDPIKFLNELIITNNKFLTYENRK